MALLAQDHHPAIPRNALAILRGLDIPEADLGDLVDRCFGLMQQVQTPVAIRVFAMDNVLNACYREPDLAHELRMVIEAQLPFASRGFLSRSRHVLKALDKLQAAPVRSRRHHP
ncbi:MAG: hypothetical protein OHK0039_29500 [Bacteroidia bacterium]